MEAISLSILVGTSVDYCFHLVEGYIIAGKAVDPALDATVHYNMVTPACLRIILHMAFSIFCSTSSHIASYFFSQLTPCRI